MYATVIAVFAAVRSSARARAELEAEILIVRIVPSAGTEPPDIGVLLAEQSVLPQSAVTDTCEPRRTAQFRARRGGRAECRCYDHASQWEGGTANGFHG